MTKDSAQFIIDIFKNYEDSTLNDSKNSDNFNELRENNIKEMLIHYFEYCMGLYNIVNDLSVSDISIIELSDTKIIFSIKADSDVIIELSRSLNNKDNDNKRIDIYDRLFDVNIMNLDKNSLNIQMDMVCT